MAEAKAYKKGMSGKGIGKKGENSPRLTVVPFHTHA